ncbi:MAG: CDP-alcohol phosphatidyltransferase family protein [Clostridia bacterium]|nr:CDP-alcohol phosphatidyltransferase family protein [Clostridia bacterium]
MLKRFKGEFFTVPNILSYVRIILIPFIVWTYFGVEPKYLAALLVALSGLTDLVDGYIARHYNMITSFGKIIDPIADKLTQVTVVACVAFRYKLMFVLVGVLIFKDLFVGVMGLLVLKATDEVEGSRWYGKIATLLFYLVIILLLVIDMSTKTADLLILCCLAGMIVSLVLYTVRYTLILTRTHNKKENIAK